jgi:hypothetical protein
MGDDLDGRLAKIFRTHSPDEQKVWHELKRLMWPSILEQASEAFPGRPALAEAVGHEAFARLAFQPRPDLFWDTGRFRALAADRVREVIEEEGHYEGRPQSVPRTPPARHASPVSLDQLLKYFRTKYPNFPDEPDRLAAAVRTLSPPDRYLLDRLAAGATHAEIALQDRVSHSTVQRRANRVTWQIRCLLGLIPGVPPA